VLLQLIGHPLLLATASSALEFFSKSCDEDHDNVHQNVPRDSGHDHPEDIYDGGCGKDVVEEVNDDPRNGLEDANDDIHHLWEEDNKNDFPPEQIHDDALVDKIVHGDVEEAMEMDQEQERARPWLLSFDDSLVSIEGFHSLSSIAPIPNPN